MIQRAAYVPEDLLTMPDGDQYELVDGRLVERPMSLWSSYVAGQILGLLLNHCRAAVAGWVLPEGTQYQCFPHDPLKVRKPDVSFIQIQRMSAEDARRQGHIKLAPDLAVEVLSPNDIVYELDEKLLDYQKAGVRLVWVVNPETRTVRIHRADGSIAQLGENDEISGEDVLPGFRCRVSEFFQAPGSN